MLDIHQYDLQNVDGIITTVPLINMEKTVIQISVIPTRRELDDIKTFLENDNDVEMLYKNPQLH
ncbi:hypothetical protein ABEZ87_31770 [Bacillus mycoides]|uniref:hypothetical protein n=1 Tax=Bacillus mycoides TaxID=1405 RepID=UPI003D2574A3